MVILGYFNFCNGLSELQMKLPSFLGYFNTFVFTVNSREQTGTKAAMKTSQPIAECYN